MRAGTSTRDIVGLWKGLLNPSVMSSIEEAEVGDPADSSSTQAEVTEVVWKLLDSRALGVDECLKSLDVTELSWLKRLCNIAGQLGTVPQDQQTGVVGHSVQKEVQEDLSQLSDHPPQPP